MKKEDINTDQFLTKDDMKTYTDYIDVQSQEQIEDFKDEIENQVRMIRAFNHQFGDALKKTVVLTGEYKGNTLEAREWIAKQYEAGVYDVDVSGNNIPEYSLVTSYDLESISWNSSRDAQYFVTKGVLIVYSLAANDGTLVNMQVLLDYEHSRVFRRFVTYVNFKLPDTMMVGYDYGYWNLDATTYDSTDYTREYIKSELEKYDKNIAKLLDTYITEEKLNELIDIDSLLNGDVLKEYAKKTDIPDTSSLIDEDTLNSTRTDVENKIYQYILSQITSVNSKFNNYAKSADLAALDKTVSKLKSATYTSYVGLGKPCGYQ